jgi:predicted RecA/RadA family phage recombinase
MVKLPSKGPLLQNSDFTYIIDSRVVSALVDEAGGIDKGQVVYAVGGGTKVTSEGNIPVAKVCIASIDDSSTISVLGIALDDGNFGDIIRVINNGIIKGINTSGFSEGDTLYLDTNGSITNTTPSMGNGVIEIGRSCTSHASDGTIQVLLQYFAVMTKHDRQIDEFSNDIITSSATFVDTGLSLTTINLGETGKYLIFVKTIVDFEEEADQKIEIVIVIDGTQVVTSKASVGSLGEIEGGIIMSLPTQAYESITSGKIVKVQWRRSSGSGTITMKSGSLMIDGIPESRIVS